MAALTLGSATWNQWSTTAPPPPPHRRKVNDPNLKKRIVTALHNPRNGHSPFLALEEQRKAERDALGDTWKTDVLNCIKRKLMSRRVISLPEVQDLLEPALAPHIYSLYQKSGARCPLSGVRLVCDTGTDKFGQTGKDDEAAFGLVRLETTGRFVVGNVLPVAKWITNSAAHLTVLRNIVVLAIEAKQFTDFCRAHPECTRVQCCSRWATQHWGTPASVSEFAKQLGMAPPRVWPLVQNGYSPYFQALAGDPRNRAFYDVAAICQRFAAQGGVCYMTGLPMWPEDDAMAPSLDRIDNARGHVTDNVLFSLHWANVSRSEATDPNFLSKMLYKVALTNPTLATFTDRLRHIYTT